MATGRFARGKASSEGSKGDARRASEIIEQESPDQIAPADEHAESAVTPADLSENVFLTETLESQNGAEVFTHDLEFKPESQKTEKVLPSDGLYGNNAPQPAFQDNPFESLEGEALETPNKGLEGTLEAISPLEGVGDTTEPSIPSKNPLELPSGLLEDTSEPPSETPKEAKKRLKAEAKQAKRNKKKGDVPASETESQSSPSTNDAGLPSYVVQNTATEESPFGPPSGNMFLDSVVKEDGVEDIIPSFAPPTKNTVAETAVEGGRTIGRTAINLVIGLCIGALAIGYFMITMGPYTLTQFGLIRNDIPVPVNAIPEGYEVIASRWGTTPAEGLAALADPFTLDATKVRIDERVVLDDGNVAYNVTCLDGSCPKGLTNTIPFQSIIGI